MKETRVPIAIIAILGLTNGFAGVVSTRQTWAAEPPPTRSPSASTSPADIFDAFRRDTVICDISEFPNAEPGISAPKLERLKLFPYREAWPMLLPNVVSELKAYTPITTPDMQGYSNKTRGAYLLTQPLARGVMPREEQCLLFLEGIAPQGGIVTSNYANIFVQGSMAGLLTLQSYALAIVHGDMTGTIYGSSRVSLIVRGAVRGTIDLSHGEGSLYLLNGLGGTVNLGAGSRVYIAGRTTEADLRAHLAGRGYRVSLETSDLALGLHQVNGIPVTVLGGSGAEQAASATSAAVDNPPVTEAVHIANQHAPLLPVSATPDVADVFCEDRHVGGDADKRYLLMSMAKPDATPPPNGYRLLLVLPGGDGSPTFNPFVKRIVQNAVPPGYLVAQLVAPEWTPDQAKNIVWPLRSSGVAGSRFTTEEFMESVIAEIAAKHKIDRRYVFALGWSSGGPPVYAETLGAHSPVTGAFVGMSVFQQANLPALTGAKGKTFFIYHSPNDFIHISQAEQARDELAANGAHTTLVTYPGGHGWTGPVFDDIQKGLLYLEANVAGAVSPTATPQQSGATSPSPATKSVNLLVNADLEKGADALPDSWKKEAPVEGVSCNWDASVGHDSKHSLCLRKTLNKFWPATQWSQTIPLSNGVKTLTVSAWVRTQDTTKAVIDVQFVGADGSLVSHKNHQWAAYIGPEKVGDPPLNHDWKLYSDTVDIPDGTVQIVIAPQIYGPGTVWFDDLSATPVP